MKSRDRRPISHADLEYFYQNVLDEEYADYEMASDMVDIIASENIILIPYISKYIQLESIEYAALFGLFYRGLEQYKIVFSNQKDSAQSIELYNGIDQQTVEEAFAAYKSIYKTIVDVPSDDMKFGFRTRTVGDNLAALVAMNMPQSIILDAIDHGLNINFDDIYATLLDAKEEIRAYRENYGRPGDTMRYSSNLYQEEYLNEIIYAAFVQSVEAGTFDLDNQQRKKEEFSHWRTGPALTSFARLNDMLSELNMEPVRQRIHDFRRSLDRKHEFKAVEYIDYEPPKFKLNYLK